MQGITNAVTSSENSELYYTKSETNALLNNKASTSLDNLSAAGQMIIDSQNGTISNCVLEIPQNIKLTLENNVLTLKAGSIVTLARESYVTYTVANDLVRANLSLTENKKYVFFTNNDGTSFTWNEIAAIGSGASLPADNSTYTVFFLTTDKNIYTWSSGAWVKSYRSYPICILESNNGTASFAKDSNGNNMIFNGAGFVGHHAFVYPKVKGLVPKGFNDDRTLSNLAVNTNALSIQEMSTLSGRCIGFQGGNNIGSFPYKSIDTVDELEQQFIYQYCSETNTVWLWSNNAWSKDTRRCPLASYNYNGTTVTDFTIRQPYQGARSLITDDLYKQIGDVETLLATV